MDGSESIERAPCFLEIAVGVYEARLLSLDLAEFATKVALREDGWRTATVDKDNGADIVDPTVRQAEVLCKSSLLQPLNDRLLRSTGFLARALTKVQASLRDVQIVRYHPGGFFSAHRDNPLDLLRGRVVTVVCYLNDEFAGGELSFPELDLCYQPRAGFGLVFPSSFLHCAAAVTEGEKLLLTGWYQADSEFIA